MGSTGNTLAAFRLQETSNVENVKVTDLTFTQNTASGNKSAYSNVTLYNGSTALATAGSASSTAAGYTYKFHFATPPVIQQNGTLVLTLKGDASSYTSGGATDNSTSTFAIATTTDITALGASSNLASTVTGTATGNTMTVLRTTLTPSATALGSQTSRVKSSVDNLANITVTANSAGSGLLRTLQLTFSGNAIGASTTVGNFILRDANNVDVTDAASYNASTTGSSCSAGSCTMLWTFSTSTNPLVISAGGSYTFTLQTNDTGFATASGSASVSLSATLQDTAAMTYYDNSSATGSTISLPSTVVPQNITNVTFAAGT
jgi:hypothetical protein